MAISNVGAAVQRYVGYCTNVHAGTTLEQIYANLERHARPVKERVAPDSAMGIGLWLPASVAQQVWDDNQAASLAEYLERAGLLPFTLNGFPYGDFHREVVKHDVYLPTWWDEPRLTYTKRLAEILDRLLPPHVEGSISTLPIAWGSPPPAPHQLQQAAAQLMDLARFLERLEAEQGRLIYVCIEPEPGCALQRSSDIIEFFQNYLFDKDEKVARRYLRVCHDICHAAVMFEPQVEVLQRFRAAGILVGKVQVSSAVRLRLDDLDDRQRAEAIGQLSQFAEHRYLHQTVVRTRDGREQFFEDLPLALAAAQNAGRAEGEWRVHFHVPIYLDRFGYVDTSRDDIEACMRLLCDDPSVVHYEVETYAWNVLPDELQQAKLSDGIALEMEWFINCV